MQRLTKICFFFIPLWLFLIITSCSSNNSSNNDSSYKLDEKSISDKLDVGFQALLSNPEQARIIGKEVLACGSANEVDISYLSNATRLVGASYQFQGNYALAFKNYTLAMNYATQSGDLSSIAATNNNIGILNLIIGNHKDAMDFFTQSLQYYKENDSLIDHAKVTNNIGLIFLELKNYEKAESNFLKAVDLYRRANDSTNIAAPIGNLGLLFFKRGELDKAREQINKAIEIAKITPNNYALTILYNEMANTFLYDKNFTEAKHFFEQTIELAKIIGKPYRIATGILGIAETKLINNELNKAIDYTNDAMGIAIDINNPILLYECYEVLSRIYEKNNDHHNAFVAYKKYRELKDDLVNQTTLHQIYNIEIEHLHQANLLQQLELDRRELAISKKNNMLWFTVILFIVSLTGLYFFYHNHRNRQKIKLQQTIINLTEKKSIAAVNAEIQERIRIGQELHDGMGQLLSVAGLNVSVLQKKKEISEGRRQELLSATMKSIDEAFSEVRNISHNLAPSLLSERGLKGALKNLADQVNQSNQLKVNFETFELNEKLNTLVENTLFRAIQEIMNNAIKHSNASELNIQIAKGNNEITLMAEDNGIGFDINKLNAKAGNGLTHMKTRIENLNGNIHIDSNPLRGTIISIVIPLNPKQNVA